MMGNCEIHDALLNLVLHQYFSIKVYSAQFKLWCVLALWTIALFIIFIVFMQNLQVSVSNHISLLR